MPSIGNDASQAAFRRPIDRSDRRLWLCVELEAIHCHGVASRLIILRQRSALHRPSAEVDS